MPTVRAPAASSGDFATTKSEGSAIVLPAFLQKSRISRASATLSSSSSDRPTGSPSARTKWFAMPPPTSRMSARRESTRKRVDLARDLGAAEDRGERPFRLEQPRQLADLLLEEQPRALLLRGARARRRPRRGRGARRRRRRPRRPPRATRAPSRTRGRWTLRPRGSAGSRAGGPRRRPARLPPGRPRARRSRRRSAPALPSFSANRTATGDSDSSGLRLPLALPRCEAQITRAPRSRASRTVGSVSTIRVSSETRPSSSGTLKSTRRKSLRPRRGEIPNGLHRAGRIAQ